MFGTFLPTVTHTRDSRLNSQTIIYTLGLLDLFSFLPVSAYRNKSLLGLGGYSRRPARHDGSAGEGRANEVPRKDFPNI